MLVNFQPYDSLISPNFPLANFPWIEIGVPASTSPRWHIITRSEEGHGSLTRRKDGLHPKSRRRWSMGTKCTLHFCWKMGRFVGFYIIAEVFPSLYLTNVFDFWLKVENYWNHARCAANRQQSSPAPLDEPCDVRGQRGPDQPISFERACWFACPI